MINLLSISIRKQILLIVLIVALPAAVAILFAGFEQRREDIEEAKRETQKLAAIISAEQTYRVAAAEQVLKILAQLPDVKHHQATKVEPLLRDLLKQNTQYSNIFISDLAGTVWASALPAKSVINIADRTYFKKALASGKLSSGEYLISRFTEKYVFTFAYPYMNEKGKISGVICLGFDLDFYKHLLSDAELNVGKSYLLLDYKGIVLARPINPEAFVGKQYDKQQFKKMQEGPENGTITEYGIDKRKRFISYRKLRLEGEQVPYMYIRAAIPVNSVMADVERSFATNLTLFALFLLMALSLAWLIGKRSIADRVKLLESASQNMADGNLSIRVSDRVVGGELGRLGQTFDVMAHQLSLREQALVESEQNYREIFNSTNEGIFVHDAESGSIIEINKTAEKMYGYTREELFHQSVRDLSSGVPPHSLQDAMGWIQKTLRDGPQTFEWMAKRKNGELFWTEVVLSATSIGGTGRVLAVVRDITERKQAEEAFKETNAKIQTLIRSLPDAVFFKDTNCRYVMVNRSFEEMMGGDQEAFIGQSDEDFMPPDLAESCRKSDEALMKSGKPVNIEDTIIGHNGKTMYLDTIKAPIYDSQGVLLGIVGVSRDITERKLTEDELHKHREQLMVLVDERTEELKQTNQKLLREITERERMEAELVRAQKLESIGILAGGIAHDFNNLLTTILGNISMSLLDLDSGHRAHRQLISAERASLRAQDLTQQLLTFSKGGEPIKRTISLADIVRESAGFALRGARTKCELFIPDHLWLVDADEGQMNQVIQNLVINADQAMPEGGTITVRCENTVLSAGDATFLGPGKYVKVTVRDTGVGISKEHLPKIFDPYFTTKQRGSGLGLATTYAIIQKHGGNINVESEPGTGTTFTIFLPASSSVRADERNETTGLTTGAGKILIMDDEEEVRKTTGDALVRLGYSVAFAEDGAQTIELYRNAMNSGEPFDVVIMDLTVPGGMGGQEAIGHLLSIDPNVQAIVSSGYSNDPIMANYQSYGFAGIVTKPYRLKQLGEVVHHVIAKKAQGSCPRSSEANT